MDYQTGETLYTYKGHHGPIRCARYHPLGICHFYFAWIYLYFCGEKKSQEKNAMVLMDLNFLLLFLGGKMASGSEDATIRIWESRIKQE